MNRITAIWLVVATDGERESVVGVETTPGGVILPLFAVEESKLPGIRQQARLAAAANPTLSIRLTKFLTRLELEDFKP